MKFLVFVICSLFFATACSFVIDGEKSCTVDNRVLKHNETGPAPLGNCYVVQCVNGELHGIHGLIQLYQNCFLEPQIPHVTKLFPGCCSSDFPPELFRILCNKN